MVNIRDFDARDPGSRPLITTPSDSSQYKYGAI